MIGAGNDAIDDFAAIHCHAHVSAGIFVAGYFIAKAGDKDGLRINFENFCFELIQVVQR